MIEEQINLMAETRRRAIARLRWCDAGLWLGHAEHFPLAQDLSLDRLIAHAGTYGIGGGLVSHWRGKTVSPQAGNTALGEIAAALPSGFFAVLSGLPLTPGEAGPLPGGAAPPPWAKAVRVFPKTHEYPFAAWCIGGLCDWLIEHSLPLLIWHTELQWPQLHALALAFPRLPIIVESQPLKIIYHVRSLWAVMQACPNIYLEISNLANASFNWMVQGLGAERFIFGSFLPMNDPLVPIGMLIDSGLGQRDQALIAAGNLRRLLGEPLP